MNQAFYQFKATSIQGGLIDFNTYKDKVLLIVNVASKCGFTPQYKELEEIYQKYKDSGFLVLGFPCNQFGGQEAASESEIQKFCSTFFEVTFPMFKKIEVNGKNEDPLYSFLKRQAKGILGTTAVKWNFTKFLVDRKGNVIDRYASATKPNAISADIEKALAESL